MAGHGGIAVSLVSKIARKKFVSALAREHHSYIFTAHLCQEPCRQRACVGAGLVREIGPLFNGIFQTRGFIQVKLGVLAAKVPGSFRDGSALVKRAPLKSYRE